MLMMSVWCVSGWCTEVTLSWGVVTVDLKAITPKEFVGVSQVEQIKQPTLAELIFNCIRIRKVSIFLKKNTFFC
jgi:hypothetical protein